MTKVRALAYGAIAAGGLAIGVSAVGIISASSDTTATLQFQGLPTASAAIPVQTAEAPREVVADDEVAATGAGFTAYQDENGNFVAPPPGTVVPQAIPRQAGPVQQFQSSVPGGGIGASTLGFQMSLTAKTNENGEIDITCDPQQNLGHDHAHDHEEQ